MKPLQAEVPERQVNEAAVRREHRHLLEEQQREDISWALASKVETPRGKRSAPGL